VCARARVYVYVYIYIHIRYTPKSHKFSQNLVQDFRPDNYKVKISICYSYIHV